MEGVGQASKSKYSFAFRCHRDKDLIYPINAIDTHPSNEYQHAFVTAGSDGMFTVWDKDKRTRYKENKPSTTPVTISGSSHASSPFAMVSRNLRP